MKTRALLLVLVLALCAFPALAQDTGTNMLIYNGVSFSYPTTLASSINITQVAGDAADVQQPGGAVMPNTQFQLYMGEIVPGSEFTSGNLIRVYNAADLTPYAAGAAGLASLQTLLSQRTDLSQFMAVNVETGGIALPLLPTLPGSEVIRARAQYIDTPALQGVSYLTALRLDVSPLMGGDLVYVFQGLTTDGAHYVSAIFPLTSTLLPAEIPADFDQSAFDQNYATYLTDTTSAINNATHENFTPSLAVLDGVIRSISVSAPVPLNPQPMPAQPGASPTLTPTAITGDASMGGLAGVAWTLTSYGDPANPTPTLGDPAVTITFSQGGVSGNAGCNSFSGEFQFENNTLTVGPLLRTMMACQQPIQAQEDAFVNALATASTFQISGSQLQINYAEGVLNFMAG
ncbi:MAG: META domain-containing protein [Chloroflexota bacterium]